MPQTPRDSKTSQPNSAGQVWNTKLCSQPSDKLPSESTAQYSTGSQFLPHPKPGIRVTRAMFYGTFPRPALVHSALGNIIWGFTLGNSYFPQISRLVMNLKDQVNTLACTRLKPKTLKKYKRTKTSNKSELGHMPPTPALGWCTAGGETGKRIA